MVVQNMKDKLDKANSEKSRKNRVKANLPEIVTGFCPICGINLYDVWVWKRPTIAGYKTAGCEIKDCPFNF